MPDNSIQLNECTVLEHGQLSNDRSRRLMDYPHSPHLASTSLSPGAHITPTWRPHRPHLVPTSLQPSAHITLTVWHPYHLHLVPTSPPAGTHITYTWHPHHAYLRKAKLLQGERDDTDPGRRHAREYSVGHHQQPKRGVPG